MIFPAEPVKPGVGKPPLKLIVPALLEKDGSSTHKEKIEPDLLTETTSKRFGGKFMTASELLIASSCEFTKTPVDKMSPTVWLPEDGEKYNVAAWAASELKIKDKKTKPTAKKYFFIFSAKRLSIR